MDKIKAKTIVLGAGASGLMFGSCINERIVFLETNANFGAKLKISGGGKCNITNANVSPKNYLCSEDGFVKNALSNFTCRDTLAFLKKQNISPLKKEDGKFFLNSSREILDIFSKTTSQHKFFYNTKVIQIEHKNDKFFITTNKQIFICEKLIVACGGASFTTLGASEIGYKIAENFGLKVVKTAPALVGLTLQKEQFWMKNLSGVSCFVNVLIDGFNYKENLLFSHRGISGPAILNASLRWQKGEICIDFLPDFEFNEKIWQDKKQLISILPLPKRVIKEYLKSENIEDKPANKITFDEKKNILKLKNYHFAPAGTFGYSKAEVTKGGVCVSEIDSVTFESKKCKNLYFLGEVLDVTGELGGYNIQWAFSSAVSCAKNFN